jgi:hypothetical protein
MYVRWRTYRSQARNDRLRAWNDERARQKAVLVESVRVGGKPRQRHIAFLGSMPLDRSDERRFWREVTARLAAAVIPAATPLMAVNRSSTPR